MTPQKQAAELRRVAGESSRADAFGARVREALNAGAEALEAAETLRARVAELEAVVRRVGHLMDVQDELPWAIKRARELCPKPFPQCTVPPPGWMCSRTPGHEGPCAASPAATKESEP